LKTATSPHRTPSAPGEEASLEHLQLQADLLDGLEIGFLAFDPEDRTLAWNQTYLRLFPEQAGHIFQGEEYVHNLRRFYQSRLSPEELVDIDRFIESAVARHRAQTQPFEFEHHGTRLRVSSLATPGRGRLRVWRTLAPLPATPPAMDFGGTLGGELLEYVPEGLVVCDGAAKVLWANPSFCALLGLHDSGEVRGATLQALYTRAWTQAGTPEHDPRRRRGTALLRDNVRFAGAPF
jgi:PAS domain-containing protein